MYVGVDFCIFVLLLVTRKVVDMKMVKELEVLVIEENVVDGDVFCKVSCKGGEGMEMEVCLSKLSVIGILIDKNVIKEENGKYVLVNFDNYDYYDIEDWWNNDIFNVLCYFDGYNLSSLEMREKMRMERMEM